MTKKYRILFLMFSLILVAALSSLNAQQQTDGGTGSCSTLVEQAMQEVGNSCAGMERNTTCYGFDQVSASFAGNVPEDYFSKPADRAGLTDLLTLQTAPFNEQSQQWGVALMNVQANVPSTLPGQAVTFILMGDTQVQNAVDPAAAAVTGQTVDIQIVPDLNAKIRSGANINTNVITTVPAGTVLKADGISPDGQWVRVGTEDRIGWVYKDLIADMTLATGLPVVSEQSLTPMQAFYFTSGIGDVKCSDAPDILFVQGPKGVKVNLNVNGADIQIGSTVAFQSQRSSYQSLSSDPKLAETYSTTLTFKDIPADTSCEKTSMVMLEGLAILNDNVSALPIGHAIDSISCRDAAGKDLLTTPWRGLRRLSQEELKPFAVIQNVPQNLLSYSVHIPNDQEISEEAAKVFKAHPTETLEATEAATETPEATDSGPGPQPTPSPESTEDS